MSFLSPGGQPCRDPCILTLGTPDVPEFPLSNTRMRPADALGALITGNVRDRNCGPSWSRRSGRASRKGGGGGRADGRSTTVR